MKKRLLLLLTVVAMMTAMLTVSIVPASADAPSYRCHDTKGGSELTYAGTGAAKFVQQFERANPSWTCNGPQ
jgi:hypothetical protein